jgi:hypothetical protein
VIAASHQRIGRRRITTSASQVIPGKLHPFSRQPSKRPSSEIPINGSEAWREGREMTMIWKPSGDDS